MLNQEPIPESAQPHNRDFAKPQWRAIDDTIHLDQFANNETLTLLAYQGQWVGQFVINEGLFLVSFDENAPKITLSDFPPNASVYVEAINDVALHSSNKISLHELSIKANCIDLCANLSVTKDTCLEAKGQMNLKGSLSAEGISCKADNIDNFARLQSRVHTIVLDAKDIHHDGAINAAGLLILKSKNCTFGKQSLTQTPLGTIILGEEVTLDGQLTLGAQLFCKAKNVTLSCAIHSLKDLYLKCDTLLVQQQGILSFQALLEGEKRGVRELNIGTMTLTTGATCEFHFALLKVKQLRSQGHLTLNHCNLNLDTLEIQGFYNLKNTLVIVNEQVSLHGDADSIAELTTFEAAALLMSGKNNCHKVDLVLDVLEILKDAITQFTNCNFHITESVVLQKEGRTTISEGFLNAGAMHWLGHSEITKSNLFTDECFTSKGTILQFCNITASRFLQDEGATIEHCVIKAESTHLHEQTSIHKALLITNTMTSHGTGMIAESKLFITKYFYTMDTCNLTFQHSYLQTDQDYTHGILNFTQGSYHKTNYIQQGSGTITLDGSVIEDKGLLFTLPQTQLLTKDKARVEVNSACLEGQSSWNDSELAALGPVVFCGKTTGEKAGIQTTHSLYFQDNLHEFGASFIKAEKNIVGNGALLFKERSQAVADQMRLSGETHFDDSKLSARELHILNQLSVLQSHVSVGQTLITYFGTIFTPNESVIEADNLKFSGKMQATRSKLHAFSDLVFAQCSSAELEEMRLAAGKAIRIERFSKWEGKGVQTESATFNQAGLVKLDDLDVSAETIHNTGQIRAQKSALFKSKS